MFVSISLPVLHAVALFAPANDTRPWLNGVNFQTTTDGHLLVSASDGVTALQVRLSAPDLPAGFNRTAPTDFIKGLPKRSDAVLAFGPTDLSVTAGNVTATGKLLPVSDVFPSLRRAAPSHDLAGQPAEFDFEQLARFSKAGKMAGWGSARLHSHGDRAGVIGFEGAPYVVGLVQRWEIKDKNKRVLPLPTVPEWLA